MSKNARSIAPSWDADFYNKYFSGAYDLITGVSGWRQDITENAIDDLPVGRLLDVGCGTGFILNLAKRKGFDVHGVDPSLGMLEKARENYGLLNGELQVASGEDLPYQDESFDVLLATGSLVHVSNLEPTAKEMVRVLKPGGVLRVIDHAPPRKKLITHPLWKIFLKSAGYLCHSYQDAFEAQSLKLIDHKTLARGGFLQLFDFKK